MCGSVRKISELLNSLGEDIYICINYLFRTFDLIYIQYNIRSQNFASREEIKSNKDCIFHSILENRQNNSNKLYK